MPKTAIPHFFGFFPTISAVFPLLFPQFFHNFTEGLWYRFPPEICQKVIVSASGNWPSFPEGFDTFIFPKKTLFAGFFAVKCYPPPPEFGFPVHTHPCTRRFGLFEDF